jgi:hypothetical protein
MIEIVIAALVIAGSIVAVFGIPGYSNLPRPFSCGLCCAFWSSLTVCLWSNLHWSVSPAVFALAYGILLVIDKLES